MRNTVKLTIGGKTYKISTETQPEHLEKIASKLNSQIEQLKNSNDNLSSLTASILIAVNCMNEFYKLEKSTQNMRVEINKYIKSSKSAVLKSKKLEQENLNLKEKVKELDEKLKLSEELNNLSKSNKEDKKEYENQQNN